MTHYSCQYKIYVKLTLHPRLNNSTTTVQVDRVLTQLHSISDISNIRAVVQRPCWCRDGLIGAYT